MNNQTSILQMRSKRVKVQQEIGAKAASPKKK